MSGRPGMSFRFAEVAVGVLAAIGGVSLVLLAAFSLPYLIERCS